MKKISIVVPMYNEQEVAPLFFEAMGQLASSLSNYELEIVAVNDGSKDDTLKILLKKQEELSNLVVVDLSRNWGHEAAVRAGLLNATGDAIIPIDADLQDPPEIIPEMVKMWEDGYQVVNAKRGSRAKDTGFKKNTAGIYYKIINKLSGKINVPENVANFRLIDRQVLDEINALDEKERVLRIEVPFVGYKTGEVLFAREERKKGQSKYNLGMMMNLAIESVVNVSTKPLRWGIGLTISTFIIFMLSSLTQLGLYIGYLNGFPGVSPLAHAAWLVVNVLLFIATLIFFMLGIIGVYLANNVTESRNRPTVIINKVYRKK